MLTVKTKIGISKIHGIGLFADQFIPKDTVVWAFNPTFDLVFTDKELESVSEFCRMQIKHYAFKTTNGRYCLPCDDNRFINYSENPNILSVDDIESSDVALIDIFPGEELTSSYNFDHQEREM